MNHLRIQQKEIHPKERAHIFSKLSFFYTLKLFKKGFQQELEEEDLYEVPSHFKSKKLRNNLEQNWNQESKHFKQSSIFRLLLRSYGFCYFVLGLIKLLANTLLIIIQPYIVSKLISYFTPSQNNLSRSNAYLYAVLVIFFNMLQCFYNHNYNLFLTGFGIKVRTALDSFIYSKVLKSNYLDDISVGKIITLITKDTQTFENFVHYGNELWIGIVKLAVIGYILYIKIGPAALVGVGFLLLIIPIQVYIGYQITSLKTEILAMSDKRLQIIQEVLSGIKTVKMCTWEKFFEAKISNARTKEVNTAFKIHFLKFIGLAIAGLNYRVAIYALIMTYIWLGYSITAEVVYFVVTCFNLLSESLSTFFPIAVYQTSETIAATKRISRLIKIKETQACDKKNYTKHAMINLHNVTVTINNKQILQEINLKFEKGLTVITGAVGSGKTSLLRTILCDFQASDGVLTVDGSISYAPQEPWFFPSSIRQNILFGEKYNEKHYYEVLKVCALLDDFELLDDGDLTIIKDHGINLSTGQQYRINLARAIYKQSDIYLLDGCLSALDSHVSDYIFRKCILSFLGDKLVILVSHRNDFIKTANNLVVLHDGKVELATKSAEEDTDTLTRNIKQNFAEELNNDKIPAKHDEDITENTHLLGANDNERKVYQEEKKSGKVDLSVYKEFIKSGGGFIILTVVFNFFVLAQFVISYTDKLISTWVNLEYKISNHPRPQSDIFEDLKIQRSTMFRTYSFMTIATVITFLTRSLAIFLYSRKVSINLHKKLVATILNAHIEFFEVNLLGNILNRFSKDFAVLDEILPFTLNDLFQIILKLIGIVALIAHVNIIFLIPTMMLFIILFVFRRCCLRTKRGLKRLEASTRSPVIGHLNATLEGLTTIKAFKVEEILKDEFHRHVDLYTSTCYMFQCSMEAFAFALDTFCIIYTAIIIVAFLMVDNENIITENVSLGISQTFMLTDSLQYGVYQWSVVENQMTSVERILQYTEAKQEHRSGSVIKKWPKFGEMLYHNVCFSHNKPILKKLNFVLKPEEKIGIVSRTGAGKSSIISVLFRLYETEGMITIDGVDIKTLSLQSLRSKISVVPQDPFLFTGTIRDNIDPLGKYTDQEMWRICERANMKSFVSNLDSEVASSGSNFSRGQKQLVCLARVIAENNKIVILDDPTAELDAETEKLICEAIEKNFASWTVIITAHKLRTILKCDKVMILDRGEIVEFASPIRLMESENEILCGMVQ